MPARSPWSREHPLRAYVAGERCPSVFKQTNDILHATKKKRNYKSFRFHVSHSFRNLRMARRRSARKSVGASPGPSSAESRPAPTEPSTGPPAEETYSYKGPGVGWTPNGPDVTQSTPSGYVMTPEQVAFKAAIDRKFFIGIGIYFVVTLAVVASPLGASSEPPADVLAAAAPAAGTRLLLTAACALFTVYWIFRSTLGDPPPEPQDSSWTFLPACFAGRFVWLTIHIDAAQLVYWILLLCVESGVLLTLDLPTAAGMHWRLLATLHSATPQVIAIRVLRSQRHC